MSEIQCTSCSRPLYSVLSLPDHNRKWPLYQRGQASNRVDVAVMRCAEYGSRPLEYGVAQFWVHWAGRGVIWMGLNWDWDWEGYWRHSGRRLFCCTEKNLEMSDRPASIMDWVLMYLRWREDNVVCSSELSYRVSLASNLQSNITAWCHS